MNVAEIKTSITIDKHLVNELAPIIEAVSPGTNLADRVSDDGVCVVLKAGLPLAITQKLLPVVQKYAAIVKEYLEGIDELSLMVTGIEFGKEDIPEYNLSITGLLPSDDADWEDVREVEAHASV